MRAPLKSTATGLTDLPRPDDLDALVFAPPADETPLFRPGALAGSTATTGTVTTTSAPSAAMSSAGLTVVHSVLAGTGQAVAFSSLFNVASLTSRPAYLIVTAVDRNEYTIGYNTAAMGHFADGSATQGFSVFNGAGWSAGLVFTYQASTGQYVNASYGALSQLVFDTGSNRGDTATISVFGTSNASLASSYANNPFVLALNPAYFTNYGSVAVLTSATAGTPPATATPGSVVGAAMGYVGAAWNDNGCWVLASDISAKAGATLPLTSSLVGVSGIANGEWLVAYDGTVAANSNWVAGLVAGEMVSFVTASGGGHITTVVSGQGAGALLIDNITYVNSSGAIVDSANDGSASDVIVQAPHADMQEFAGVNPANVVVYELDCPVVTSVGSVSAPAGSSLALAADFSASNPAPGQGVTSYQVYESNAADALAVSGTVQAGALSASAACTLSSLSALSLNVAAAGSDTVLVRAYNGQYWGDWTALAVSVAAPATPPASPAPPVPITAAAAAASTASGIVVADSGAAIAAWASQLETLAVAGKLASVTVTSGAITLTAAQYAADAQLLAVVTSPYTLALSGCSVAAAAGFAASSRVVSVAVTDSAAHVAAGLDALQALAAANRLGATTLTDGGTPILSLSATQLANDHAALAAIGGAYTLAISGSSAANAYAAAASAHVGSVSVVDSAAHVVSALDSLESVALAGKLGAITLTNPGVPTLALTAAQVTADAAALARIASPVHDSITGTAGADRVSLAGITAPITVNLLGNTATAAGGLGASTLRFLGTPDTLTLGSGPSTVVASLAAGSGIETVTNFKWGVDTIQLALGGLGTVTAVDTHVAGQHAVALTGGNLSQGVVLLGQSSAVTASSILATHVHTSGGVAVIG